MPTVVLLVMGVSAYLAMHYLWVWMARRSQVMYLWIGIWCLNSLVYQASRFFQLTATSSSQLHLADRAAFSSGTLVIIVIVLMGREVARATRSATFTSCLLIMTGAVLAIHWSTDLFITSEIDSYTSWFGTTVPFSRVGPLYMPFLVLASAAAYAYGCFIFIRARHLEPRQRYAIIAGISAYMCVGMHDVLLFDGWFQSVSLFEYGFAAVAVSLNVLMVDHIHRVQDNLGSIVAAQTRELRTALDLATAADRAKTQFLANMSHEIRTPLNGVIGMTRLVLRTGLDAEQRALVETINRSGDTLLAIVNDILDFSKIEAGRLELHWRAFALPSLVADVCELFRSSAEERGIKLQHVFQGDIPERVEGDPTRLRQVLTNLLSNATRFTEHGEIVVTTTWLPAAAGPAQARIEVTDTGIGLAEADIERLFDPFFQVDSSSTRRYGGTGIGLAICKHLVDLMGGEIGVTSTLGKGSTFWFSLPLEETEPMTPAGGFKLTAPATPQMDSAKRILVVEDNIVNREVAVRLARSMGYQVDTAGNGSEALSAVDRASYGAILMDIQMPVMDGLEATAEIRRRPDERAQVPIIAMSASVLPGDRERCIAAGMDDFLAKPVDVDQMEEVLGRCYSNCRSSSDAS
jgi:signal transduction histidine kinase/ActR/RegA family two-component response regulator